MSKRQSASYAAGAVGATGDAPPQYLQDGTQPSQGQNYGPPGPPQGQQNYTSGQYGAGPPATQPYGTPSQPQQPYNTGQIQNGQYPPPATNPHASLAAPTMVGSSAGGPPSNAGYYGSPNPAGPYVGAPLPGQGPPFMQNYGPGTGPGGYPNPMNQDPNAMYNNKPPKPAGQAKSMAGWCLAGVGAW